MNHGPRFNLSDWALKHRSFVWFLLIVSMLAGAISYANLGREEDPNFTIKVITIAAAWPGATAQEMQDQVAEPLEKRMQELTQRKEYIGKSLWFLCPIIVSQPAPEFFMAPRTIKDTFVKCRLYGKDFRHGEVYGSGRKSKAAADNAKHRAADGRQ